MMNPDLMNPLPPDVLASFASRLIEWFDVHGRHDLPWQVKNDPYKVWVSEIMLQQTQVKTVLNYFDRFMQRFPTVQSLAEATWEEVAPYWAGLGYYARARNLHKAAKQVVVLGRFPQTLDEWMSLSGVGRSTGGALMSLGLGKYGVIMDGNVKRVLCRHQAIEGDSSSSAVISRLWEVATELTPLERHDAYTQAIMDLGATLCTLKKPLCTYCPLNADCQAYLQNRVEDFPQKKAKKASPVKQAYVLLLQHEGQYVWQQRPDSGLWGGLTSLPILDTEQGLQDFLQEHRLQMNAQLAQVKHVFTHFTWLLTPVLIQVETDQQDTMTAHFENAEWLSLAQVADKGIPKAMHKVIELL